MVSFKDWNNLEVRAKREKQKAERERLEQEREDLRKVTACFTGHRPPKLGGYDWKNPTMLQLKEKLLEVLRILIVEDGITRFISGGALGTDQAGFWCVEILKKEYPHLQNIVAIPFKNQDAKWSKEQKVLYTKMLKRADAIVDVATLPEYDTKEAPTLPVTDFSNAKMQKRNEYMVDMSRVIIGVSDGSKGGTANCLRYAHKSYGNRMIWTLNPKYGFEPDVRFTI